MVRTDRRQAVGQRAEPCAGRDKTDDMGDMSGDAAQERLWPGGSAATPDRTNVKRRWVLLMAAW